MKHKKDTFNRWSYAEMAVICVAWYRQHGKYGDRIGTDSGGVKYVIGDWSWNRRHPGRQELIDDLLSDHNRNMYRREHGDDS